MYLSAFQFSETFLARGGGRRRSEREPRRRLNFKRAKISIFSGPGIYTTAILSPDRARKIVLAREKSAKESARGFSFQVAVCRPELCSLTALAV